MTLIQLAQTRQNRFLAPPNSKIQFLAEQSQAGRRPAAVGSGWTAGVLSSTGGIARQGFAFCILVWPEVPPTLPGIFSVMSFILF